MKKSKLLLAVLLAFSLSPHADNINLTSTATVPALPAMPLMASVLIGYGVIRRRMV